MTTEISIVDQALSPQWAVTEAQARALTDQIKTSLGCLEEAIESVITGQAWIPLGYASFQDYWRGEGLEGFRLQGRLRAWAVARLKEDDPTLTTRAIARAVGSSKSTVARELSPDPGTPDSPVEAPVGPASAPESPSSFSSLGLDTHSNSAGEFQLTTAVPPASFSSGEARVQTLLQPPPHRSASPDGRAEMVAAEVKHLTVPDSAKELASSIVYGLAVVHTEGTIASLASWVRSLWAEGYPARVYVEGKLRDRRVAILEGRA